jgi:sugar/nucleoside kinase (ribokinase family)
MNVMTVPNPTELHLTPYFAHSKAAVAVPYCLPSDSTRFKNACGAGDCAVAGFLTALLKGESIEVAADYAMAAGRDNLYGVDALSGLTAWDTMTACIARNK